MIRSLKNLGAGQDKIERTNNLHSRNARGAIALDVETENLFKILLFVLDGAAVVYVPLLMVIVTDALR